MSTSSTVRLADLYDGLGESQVMAMIRRLVNLEKWQAQGASYAWGRMDAGEPAVVGAHGADVNAADTARAFSDLYTAMMTEFWERRRVSAIATPSAWENFRLSGGASVEYPRLGQVADLPV